MCMSYYGLQQAPWFRKAGSAHVCEGCPDLSGQILGVFMCLKMQVAPSRISKVSLPKAPGIYLQLSVPKPLCAWFPSVKCNHLTSLECYRDELVSVYKDQIPWHWGPQNEIICSEVWWVRKHWRPRDQRKVPNRACIKYLTAERLGNALHRWDCACCRLACGNCSKGDRWGYLSHWGPSHPAPTWAAVWMPQHSSAQAAHCGIYTVLNTHVRFTLTYPNFVSVNLFLIITERYRISPTEASPQKTPRTMTKGSVFPDAGVEEGAKVIKPDKTSQNRDHIRESVCIAWSVEWGC